MIRDMLTSVFVRLIERGLVPDSVTRAGIRRLLRERLETAGGESTEAVVREMCRGPIAPVPEKANEQHYEVPAGFYTQVLGPRLKYSSGWFGGTEGTLAAAEQDALLATCRHADLANGQDVLELGCGWGSLTLTMAERYPESLITAVSNSSSQRRFIMERARERGLRNVRVFTADMNEFDSDTRFDRVVSVEMFEHMRNWGGLLERVSGWLKPDGKLFVHVFRHREHSYFFEPEGASNWMGRHFFTGGLMPGADLFGRFDEHLSVARRWDWDGTHYARTAEAWLENLDRNRAGILPVLEATYGRKNARRWLHRWRMFFMACAELFAFDGGREWGVSHYLLEPAATAAHRDPVLSTDA